MTSRELVEATVSFQNTSGRVPREMWSLPWVQWTHPDMLDKINRDFPPDIVTARPAYREKSPVTRGDAYTVGQYVDDWGSIFTNKQAGIVGEVKQPLVEDEDWQDAGKIHIPTEWLSFDTAEVDAFCAGSQQYVLAEAIPRPFEQLQFIRGTENFFIDLMDPPPKMLAFLGEMHAFYCRLLEKWGETGVDALQIMDDWGTQKSLLISPEVWVKIFKPLYKDYIDIAHKHGKRLFMHSDGNTLAILPHLIELGLDAFNTQLFCMDFSELAQYAGQITFWGELDRQHILPYGSQDDARAGVEKIMSNLWKNGGVIAQMEFSLGAKPENVYAAYERWNRYGAK